MHSFHTTSKRFQKKSWAKIPTSLFGVDCLRSVRWIFSNITFLETFQYFLDALIASWRSVRPDECVLKYLSDVNLVPFITKQFRKRVSEDSFWSSFRMPYSGDAKWKRGARHRLRAANCLQTAGTELGAWLYHPRSVIKKSWKIYKNFCQDNQSPNQDSKWEPLPSNIMHECCRLLCSGRRGGKAPPIFKFNPWLVYRWDARSRCH